MPDDKLVEVFESSNPGLLALAKSVLEGAGIDYSAVGENTGAIFAGNPFFGRVRLEVSDTDEEEATSLLAELRQSDSS